MRRAMRDDQKEQRRQAILDVAHTLFEMQPYETISMAEVASRAGLAKGTLYLYFQTKEELFLALFEQEFTLWFDAVDAHLPTLTPSPDPTALVTWMTASLTSRPALIRLFALAHVILERNASYEAIVHLKRHLNQRVVHTGTLLERCLPTLAAGQGVFLLLQAYAFIIGIQNLTDPAPLARQAMAQEPDLQPFALDFAPVFQTTLIALIRGTVAG